MKNIENMNDEELMSAWTALGEKVEENKKRLREFSQEHQKRERIKQLNLEPGDLALLQGVSPEGIESQEKVGN